MTQFNLSAYLGVFLDEVEEQLQVLDSEILVLEKDPSNTETIQNIFRAAHTLKGSSAAMGFEKMKEFTHHLENIFDLIRNLKISVTPDLVNVIFESIDFIKVLKEAIVEGNLEHIDIEPAVQKLTQHEKKTSQPPAGREQEAKQSFLSYMTEDQQAALQQGIQSGKKALEITVKLDDAALMKNVRALLIYNNIQEVGEVVAAFPSVQEMENEVDFSGSIKCFLLTMQTLNEVKTVVHQMSDVQEVDIQEVAEETAAQLQSKEEAAFTESRAALAEEENKKPVPVKTKVTPTVRVDVDKLEHLMNLVGELVIDQTRLVDVRSRLAEKDSRQEEDMDVLDEVTNHLSRVITELQEGMMKTRMLPIEQLFNRFPRMVRDTSLKAQKEIEFTVKGKETELDRTLIEEISDPIIHLLRNSIDHGIESPAERKQAGKPAKGKIELSASHVENHIVISVKDDGKGIDPARIKKTAIEKGTLTEEEADKLSDRELLFLIFKSGVSTAKEITDISGRGVGMDIVRAHIEKLNGIIDIESEVGIGTTFTIKLPLTLAIISSLLVKFGEKTFAIPLVNVLEIIRLNKEDIQMVKGKEVGLVRDRVLPLVRMKEKMNIDAASAEHSQKKREFVVVVGIADKRIGLIADKTLGNQEIVIKSLGSYIGSPPYISGATLMGDGNVALILDVSSIVREEGTQDMESRDDDKKRRMEEERQFVTFKLDQEEYGLDIQRIKDIVSIPPITKVIQAPEDVMGMINLRGNMLPVIDLRKRFKLGPEQKTKKSRIIVVDGQQQDIGFLVDEVTQVLKTSTGLIEKPPEKHQYNYSPLFKGISKLNDRVVMLLECDEILKSVALPVSGEPNAAVNQEIFQQPI